MFGNADPEMGGALLVAESASHGGGAETLPPRAFVDETVRNKKLIDVERRSGVFGLALGVGDGAAQHLFDVLGGALRRVLKRLEGVLDAASANQVDHQARLLRGQANVPREGVRFDRRSLCMRLSHELCLWRRRSSGRSTGGRRAPRGSRASRLLESDLN